MATCLSQLYHEYTHGIKAGYAKFETFPIWNIPLKHPVNLAYEAAFMAGAILAGADDRTVEKMEKAGNLIGVAFQIQDDILDVTSTQEVLGKPVLSDEKNHKSTYVTLGSLESAKALAQEAVDKAKASLVDFGENAEFLRALVDYLITRNK